MTSTGGLRAFSFGGGVQSTAALVLAAQGRIDFPTFVFANVGDDSEKPATLRYVRDVAMPFAREQGIALHELRRTKRDGSTETLMGLLTREGSRSVDIPVRMAGSGAPGTRQCTKRFKIQVVSAWLREHGATTDSPAVVGVGISTNEIHRVNNRRVGEAEVVEYPLIALGLNRNNCAQVIRDAGLPVPPKSACFFCPLQSIGAWREMRRDEPELFEQSAELEDLLNKRREMLGKDPVYLSRRLIPLRELPEAEPSLLADLEDETGCDQFSCFT